MRNWICTAFFLIILNTPVFSENRHEFFEQAELLMNQNKYEKSILTLNKILKENRQPHLKAKTYFLLSWNYFLQKNYSKSLLFSKKIFTDFKKSAYYRPSLFLSMTSSMLSGRKKTAGRIFTWLSKSSSFKNNEVFTLALFQRTFNIDNAPELKTKMQYGLLRLCWEFLPVLMQKSALKENKSSKTENNRIIAHKTKKKKTAIIPVKRKNSKQLKKSFPEKTNKPQFSIKKYNFLERKEMKLKQFEKKLKVQEKKLRILKILLAEKKRLLYLKEKFLEEKAKALSVKKRGKK